MLLPLGQIHAMIHLLLIGEMTQPVDRRRLAIFRFIPPAKLP